MDPRPQALLTSAGFVPDGVGMKLRYRGVTVDAVDHPFYGISLWAMSNTGRTLAECEVFVPFEASRDELMAAINIIFDKLEAPKAFTTPQRPE
jgi:hypothetical protein